MYTPVHRQRVAQPASGEPDPRRFPTATTRAVRWLLVTVLAPMAIWAAGRGIERLWFGPESRPLAPRAAEASRQRVEQQYRALFDDLSAAAETAAQRPDLLRTADQPASGKALFELAASAMGQLRAAEDHAALTIYDRESQPVAWAGHPSDQLGVQSLAMGVRMVGGPSGVRVVHAMAVSDGRTQVGTVIAERVLAREGEISNRYLNDFDFTVTAAGLPVAVTYFTGEIRTERATESDASSFVIRDPSGEPIARVTIPASALEANRESLRGIVRSITTALGLVGFVGLVLAVASLFKTGLAGRAARLLALVAAMWLLRIIMLWTSLPLVTRPGGSSSPVGYVSSGIEGLLYSPADFALTAAAVLGSAIAATVSFEWLRRAFRDRRLSLHRTGRQMALYGLIQVSTALLALTILIGYDLFIANTVAHNAIDLRYFSFHPWSTARLALQVGFIAFHAAAVLVVVLVFRLGFLVFRRPVPRRSWLPAQLALWTVAVVLVRVLILRRIDVPFWPLIAVYGMAALSSYYAERLTARIRRHTVSAPRLAAIFVAVLVPSLLFSSVTTHYSEDNKKRLVESGPAQQALQQRQTQLAAFQQSLKQIDALDAIDPVFAVQNVSDVQAFAFRLWSRTDLAALRLTSVVEIYDESGVAVSRFALNFPSYRQQLAPPPADVSWHVAEDAMPLPSLIQRVMSASRRVYLNDQRVGTITIRVARDYDTLPFISSQNPYFELFRPTVPEPLEAAVMRDIELAVYDWQRRPVYASTRPVWPVGDDLLQRIRRNARPFWTTLARGGGRDDVFVFWDAEQIYLIGYPYTSWWESFVAVAELVVLVGAVYWGGLLVLTLAASALGRQEIWPLRLPGELRTSFYGKLVLAFVAASTAPMVILSLSVHAQFESYVRADEETAAQTNVTVARRVVEGYEASGRTALVDDDDVMVWIRSLVGQDVSVFAGGRLVATSQRDLFTAGLLPPLAPGPVYQTIALDRADQYVGDERIGSFSYMIASTPIRFAGRDGILTLPLALRQQVIDSKIDALDRGLLLVTLVFVLGAASLGYRTADRLAAPIRRLTHAAGRLGTGQFHALPVTIPGDEVQQLVGAFNQMAADLEVQRGRLEHTTRVEASAEMARRVAHDIKNPLTPVQLSAEHLLRVAVDQGHAPRSVVEVCVENILRQVRTLREIASEFSSFGTSPVPRPEPLDVGALLEEIALSYGSGLDGRVELVTAVSPDLPRAMADRVLVARALTNLVENALHAMPDQGRLTLSGQLAGERRVAIDIVDTGSGIAPEVLRRIFEPYFSTRTGGTGLGMAIVKRNIEANGGTIQVTSTPGQGTAVRVVLPTASV